MLGNALLPLEALSGARQPRACWPCSDGACGAAQRGRTPGAPARAGPAAGGVAYTRRVTQVWCGFFVRQRRRSRSATALWASEAVWALYNGVLSYVLMGLLFAGEWLVRRRVRARIAAKPMPADGAPWMADVAGWCPRPPCPDHRSERRRGGWRGGEPLSRRLRGAGRGLARPLAAQPGARWALYLEDSLRIRRRAVRRLARRQDGGRAGRHAGRHRRPPARRERRLAGRLPGALGRPATAVPAREWSFDRWIAMRRSWSSTRRAPAASRWRSPRSSRSSTPRCTRWKRASARCATPDSRRRTWRRRL